MYGGNFVAIDVKIFLAQYSTQLVQSVQHWYAFVLVLAFEPPYGGCLTSHNAQDPDLFKLSCQLLSM